jgi:RHS repeat-associated protein
MLDVPRLPHRLAVARPALGQGLASLLAFLGVFCWRAPRQRSSVEYYHTDSVGNVRAITDEQKPRHRAANDYLPFGEECTTGPALRTPACGAPGAQVHWARSGTPRQAKITSVARYYYGSTLGRFTSVDPIYTWRENLVDPQRWNRYGSYARNNPLKYTDPDGRAINLVAGAIGAESAGWPALSGQRGLRTSEVVRLSGKMPGRLGRRGGFRWPRWAYRSVPPSSQRRVSRGLWS